MKVKTSLDLTGRVAVITGGAGLLGLKHAEAIAEMGGVPVLLDVNRTALRRAVQALTRAGGAAPLGLAVNVANCRAVEKAREEILRKLGRIDILINNAAIDPKVTQAGADFKRSRFEYFSKKQWERELSVGLTGAFLCSQVFGSHMAQAGGGVILNICSDLAVIAPDQRLYRKKGRRNNWQPVKPATYSVIKTGLLGLTRYLATYWCDRNIRVNALSPGGVYNGQPDEFVKRFSKLVPLSRMAKPDEYKAAVVFLVSNASSYMTGGNLIIDGGRTCW